jgi:hypothetical protein
MDLRLLPVSVYSMGEIFNIFFGSSRPLANLWSSLAKRSVTIALHVTDIGYTQKSGHCGFGKGEACGVFR